MIPHPAGPFPPDLYSVASFLLPALQSTVATGHPGTEVVDAASRTVTLVIGVLCVAILLPVVFLVYRKFFHSLGAVAAPVKSAAADPGLLEGRGDIVAAAEIYEQRGDFKRAAALYDRGKDFGRAAFMFEKVGDLQKAAQLYLRSGGSARAAGLYMKLGEYMEAAKIFRNKGDHLRAGKALETYGNKAAAAREYREAGQFEPAARLLREAGMTDEAAETFRLSLKDETLDHSNVDRFYIFGAFLALAGKRAEAARVYRDILHLKGDYRKAAGNLRALGYDERGQPVGDAAPVLKAAPAAAPPEGPSPPLQEPEGGGDSSPPSGIDESCLSEGGEKDQFRKETSLRSMIAYGRLDLKYSMRLWIQIMRALAQKHESSVFYGCLTPEMIRIDMQNNIDFDESHAPVEAYTAPEVRAGQAPGPHSDIYAMGVILFEMVTGSLEHLGESRPTDLLGDIPSWLDDLIMKCTMKDRRDRFLNTEGISSMLVNLKSSL